MAKSNAAGERQALQDVTNLPTTPATDGSKNKPIVVGAGDKTSSDCPSSTASAGQKRKSNDASEDVNLDDVEIPDGEPIDKSCNQIRAQIRRFIESGEMKVGEFCDTIGVSNKSLNAFLRQNGKTAGSSSNTYFFAWQYFKKREIAGLKMPRKKVKLSSKSNGASNDSATGNTQLPDWTSINLDGEDERSIPVYDTCDEVRRKINAHLNLPNVTKAQFCRDLAAQVPNIDKIQGKQLTDFRSKHGADSGNTSVVFYAAYAYFEKLRIAGDKPKSKHRLEMEKAWPKGFDTERPTWHGVLCMPNQRPFVDNLGRLSIHRIR